MKLRALICLLLLAGAAFAEPVPVPPGLVAWYAGDGRFNDISGNGLNPTVEFGPPIFQPGIALQAMRFGLTPDSGFSVPDNDLLDIGPTDSFTIEFWATSSEFTGMLVDKRAADPLTGQVVGYAVYKNFNGTVADNKFGANGCNLSINFHQIGLPTASAIVEPVACVHGFRHFAFTYDRPTNVIRVYIDGALKASVAPAVTIGDLSNSSPLFVAHRSSDFFIDAPWTGAIDELSFYKRALTAAEVDGIHIAGANGKEKNAGVPAGPNVVASVGDVTATFPEVSTAGVLREWSLDPAALPTLPFGFLATDLFYDVSTTAVFTGPATLCFNLPLFDDPVQFANLRLLHLEGGNWVNRTTSSNFATRTLCGQSPSLSPFAIAETLAPTAASVTVSGRVIDAAGNGVANARIALTNQRGESISSLTNAFGQFRLEDVAAGETYILSARRKGHLFEPMAITPTDSLGEIEIREAAKPR